MSRNKCTIYFYLEKNIKRILKYMKCADRQNEKLWKHNSWRIRVCIMLVFRTTARKWARASSFTRFLDHTQRRIRFGRTSLDEWSARRRDLYLTTHNTHNRQTSMPPVGFEPTISAGERPQTYALDRAATDIHQTPQSLCYLPRGHELNQHIFT